MAILQKEDYVQDSVSTAERGSVRVAVRNFTKVPVWNAYPNSSRGSMRLSQDSRQGKEDRITEWNIRLGLQLSVILVELKSITHSMSWCKSISDTFLARLKVYFRADLEEIQTFESRELAESSSAG